MWVIQNILAEVAKDPSYNPLDYTLDLAEKSYEDASLLALIPVVRCTRVCVSLCTVLLKSALRSFISRDTILLFVICPFTV